MFQIKKMSETRAVIRANGPVVASTAQALRGAFKELTAEGVREVVIDMSGVEDVDSIGISVFISAHVALSRFKGSLILENVGPDLYNLFLGMRLGEHFTIKGQA